MATFEGMGFCDKQEYKDAFESRIKHNELTRGQLYVARFNLLGSDDGYRILGRVGMITANSANTASVDIQLVNDMLEPTPFSPAGSMIDGIWNFAAGGHLRAANGEEFDMVNACLSGYEGNVGTDFEAQIMLELERHRQLT